MVSPAPPSKRTLSGRTTAAVPPILSSLTICWRKLSCLFAVVAQNSSRSYSCFSVVIFPSSPTMVYPPFAEGRIGEDHVELPATGLGEGVGAVDRSSGILPLILSRTEAGSLSYFANPVQIHVHRTKTDHARNDVRPPKRLCLQVLPGGLVQLVVLHDVVVGGEEEAAVPQAGSPISWPGCGRITSTMARMSGRGVKYCPAPLSEELAVFSRRPS